jgi:hypothetical protein
VLEPLAETHREALWEAAQSVEIWQWTSRIAADRKDFDAWIELGLNREGDGARQAFATIGVRDSAFFSVIDDEWPDVRSNLLARLERRR